MSPYKLGDGNETMAISLSKGYMATDWVSGTNAIQIYITTKLKVALVYVDNTVAEQAKAAQKAKEKADF
jgi:hypothetical protein